MKFGIILFFSLLACFGFFVSYLWWQMEKMAYEMRERNNPFKKLGEDLERHSLLNDPYFKQLMKEHGVNDPIHNQRTTKKT